jgi:hypothetical protein
MNSYEIVKQNVHLKTPSRIALNLGEENSTDFLISGMDTAKIFTQKKWKEGKFEFYDDLWGNIWHRLEGMSQGGEIFKPVIEDWSQLTSFKLPALLNDEVYDIAKNTFKQDTEKYHLFFIIGFPFSICRYLRRMEIYFQDLVLERDNIDKLHSIITDLLEKIIIKTSKTGAHGIFFCEDWGIQDRTLIHPDMFREIFKPLFIRLCGTAHKHNLDVFMHSCGYNWDILGDLAESGVNVFQFDQPALYGLERLAKRLKELNVCLMSPVDIQKILPTGNKKIIVETAEKMADLFGEINGGFIATQYNDLKGIGVKPEWDNWATEAFLRKAGVNKTATSI